MLNEKDHKVFDQNELNELAFFDSYYLNNHYNPIGWHLRLEREIKTISVIAKDMNKKFGRVLSIGCGDGQFEIMLAPLADEIIGIDLSPEAIKLATKSAEIAGTRNVTFECASVLDTQWTGKFDTVIALAFFHHVPSSDLPNLISQVYNSLRPGGILYSSDPNEKAILRSIGRAVMGSSYNKYHSPGERELNPTETKRMIQEAGFKNISITWTDFTLIPTLYILKQGPDWPLYIAKWMDAILVRSSLCSLASTFGLIAIKDEIP